VPVGVPVNAVPISRAHRAGAGWWG
jgi:hypothetical protein